MITCYRIQIFTRSHAPALGMQMEVHASRGMGSHAGAWEPETDEAIEFWLAKELQHLLAYSKWCNFHKVLLKAKTACEISEQNIDNHFVEVNKMVDIGSGAQKEVDDIILTRYACYLITQNGDSKKQPIAFAQTYFAIQTRKAELIEQRLLLKAKDFATEMTVFKKLRI